MFGVWAGALSTLSPHAALAPGRPATLHSTGSLWQILSTLSSNDWRGIPVGWAARDTKVTPCYGHLEPLVQPGSRLELGGTQSAPGPRLGDHALLAQHEDSSSCTDPIAAFLAPEASSSSLCGAVAHPLQGVPLR